MVITTIEFKGLNTTFYKECNTYFFDRYGKIAQTIPLVWMDGNYQIQSQQIIGLLLS
jgi:hypothetical protein